MFSKNNKRVRPRNSTAPARLKTLLRSACKKDYFVNIPNGHHGSIYITFQTRTRVTTTYGYVWPDDGANFSTIDICPGDYINYDGTCVTFNSQSKDILPDVFCNQTTVNSLLDILSVNRQSECQGSASKPGLCAQCKISTTIDTRPFVYITQTNMVMITRQCTGTQYRCTDGRCIPDWFMLDGQVDCPGGEDENKSIFPCLVVHTHVTRTDNVCEQMYFKCSPGHYILWSKTCDGRFVKYYHNGLAFNNLLSR